MNIQRVAQVSLIFAKVMIKERSNLMYASDEKKENCERNLRLVNEMSCLLWSSSESDMTITRLRSLEPDGMMIRRVVGDARPEDGGARTGN